MGLFRRKKAEEPFALEDANTLMDKARAKMLKQIEKDIDKQIKDYASIGRQNFHYGIADYYTKADCAPIVARLRDRGYRAEFIPVYASHFDHSVFFIEWKVGK